MSMERQTQTSERGPLDIVGVFEGGGIKGIGLAGAAAVAMDTGHRFRRIVGTSAGAMVGSMIAAGYDADELRSLVRSIEWPALLDPTPMATIPWLGHHIAVVLWRGIYRGDRLERTWKNLLRAKGVRTFGDLEPGSLRMVATDLTHGTGIVLPNDLARYGIDPNRFSVAKAVRMSASVPFAFRTVRLRSRQWKRTVEIADGALAARFPSQLADSSSDLPVVGFRLGKSLEDHPHQIIRGPMSLAAAVMSAGMSAGESLPNLCSGLANVVSVVIERQPLDFDITSDEAEAMFDLGRDAATSHFASQTIG